MTLQGEMQAEKQMEHADKLARLPAMTVVIPALPARVALLSADRAA